MNGMIYGIKMHILQMIFKINNGFSNSENNIDPHELFNYFINFYNIDKSEKILDFGCGTGRIGQYFIRRRL